MQASIPRLSEAHGRALIRLARAALKEKLGQTAAADPAPGDAALLGDPVLQNNSGIFVTLTIGKCLRGCIGSLEGREPLVAGVRTYALHAAFNDPRFTPLTAQELETIKIEVSVLTPPRPLSYADAEELKAKVRPRVDGVTIRKGDCSATFLPQVWEQLPDTENFLDQLCLKAGLPADTWRSGRLSVETYQVQYFEE